MNEIGCDPGEYLNSIIKPMDPNKRVTTPIPDRVVELHKANGQRSPLEKSVHSTYYPMKSKKK